MNRPGLPRGGDGERDPERERKIQRISKMRNVNKVNIYELVEILNTECPT